MPNQQTNPEVTTFLDNLTHPFRAEIEQLRDIILSAEEGLTENIKWNAPNYCFEGEDRITMRIQPPKQIQLIFHCGAKVKEQPKNSLITDTSGLLMWKENNRAVATFKNITEIQHAESTLIAIVKAWIHSAK